MESLHLQQPSPTVPPLRNHQQQVLLHLQCCNKEHGWEVAGHWVSMVTRRADELRMNELKKNYDYRATNAPIVVASTGGKEYKAKESVSIVKAWDGNNSIYCPYPSTEVEKNPNLVR